MEQYAAQIIGAIILGLLVWLLRETHANGRELTVIKTRLFGTEREDEGGLAGEVKRLHKKAHDHGDKLHEHGLRLQALEACEEQP